MRILVTDTYELTAEQRDVLAAMGLELETCPDGAPYPGDPAQIDIVACKMLFRHTPIQRFTRLKFIQLFMAGFEHMPMDYIRAHGIEFHNARDVYSVPIAEFGIGGVLALYKDFRIFEAQRRERRWELRRYLPELEGRRVLILGAGSIGTEFARRFRAFGCPVTGLARTAGARPCFDEVLSMDALDEVLPGADIVVLCLPNDPATRHIMDGARLARMKPGALLVNIARGALVDEPALIAALRSGRLGGAVLDVFETEPLPPDSPLWEMENVIVTPHTSFGAEHNRERLFEIMVRNLSGSDILKK